MHFLTHFIFSKSASALTHFIFAMNMQKTTIYYVWKRPRYPTFWHIQAFEW